MQWVLSNLIFGKLLSFLVQLCIVSDKEHGPLAIYHLVFIERNWNPQTIDQTNQHIYSWRLCWWFKKYFLQFPADFCTFGPTVSSQWQGTWPLGYLSSCLRRRRPRHPGHTKALFACLHVILINILTPLFIIVYLSVCPSVSLLRHVKYLCWDAWKCFHYYLHLG